MVDVDRNLPLTRETPAPRVADMPRATERGVADGNNRLMETGSVGEAIGGAAALILAFLGLIGLLPVTLGAVATIALGGALLLGGAAVARRYSRLFPAGTLHRVRQEVAGALGLQALAGLAGLVLGILVLLRVDPVALLGISSIVFGSALVVAGGGVARLERSARWIRRETGHPGDSEGLYLASGWEALVGIAGVVLGILALTGHAPLILALVAMLSIGAAILVSGTLFAARLFSIFG